MHTLCLLRTATMKIEWELAFFSSGECLKKVFRRHGDAGSVQRAAQRRRVHGEVPVLRQGHPYNTQNVVHQVRDFWRSQSYNALHYQQEQFKHAVQEHQRVTYEQFEIAAALATRHTATHLMSRFRDTEKLRLRLISVMNSKDHHQKLHPSHLSHSKLSDIIWFKKLQQR